MSHTIPERHVYTHAERNCHLCRGTAKHRGGPCECLHESDGTRYGCGSHCLSIKEVWQ